MPIDYKKYPPNWKSEIRPRILTRAGNRCEQCQIENYQHVIRGIWHGKDAYQKADGTILSGYDPSWLDHSLSEGIDTENPGAKSHRVVLTIAHINHDVTDNRDENLKALCQRCHLRHDKDHHASNSRKTREAKA